MTGTTRSGVIHVLESVIAATLLLLFLVTVMPTADQTGTDTRTTAQRVHHVLSTLDATGDLRSLAYSDLETLRDRVATYLPGRQVEIAVTYVNSTVNHTRFDGTHSTDFTVPTGAEEHILHVWYRDAAAPNITVNGASVDETATDRVNDHEQYDITGMTAVGTNELDITVSDTSRIGYTIDTRVRERTGAPPENQDVFTTSYTISGNSAHVTPMEVTVLSWQ